MTKKNQEKRYEKPELKTLFNNLRAAMGACLGGGGNTLGDCGGGGGAVGGSCGGGGTVGP